MWLYTYIIICGYIGVYVAIYEDVYPGWTRRHVFVPDQKIHVFVLNKKKCLLVGKEGEPFCLDKEAIDDVASVLDKKTSCSTGRKEDRHSCPTKGRIFLLDKLSFVSPRFRGFGMLLYYIPCIYSL